MSVNPKNKANTSVLTRHGPADYVALSTDTKPTPQADEDGSILLYSDTGCRFEWTSTKWIQTYANGLPIPRDYKFEVADGNVEGESLTAIVSRNASFGTTFEDVWGEGGVMVYPTAAETWEIVSDNAADSAAGTGARTIFVTSLDDSVLVQTQTVTMNGTTPVTLTGTHFRPQSIIALTAGSNETNVGKITLRVSGGGNVRNVVLPDLGQSQDAHFTIPANQTGKILTTLILYPKDGSGVFRNRFRSSLAADSAWVTGSMLPMYQNIVPFGFESLPLAASGLDIQLQVKSDSGILDASVLFEVLLKDN